MVFVCGRSDGAAFKPDAVGCDVVAAFAGKETALAADAAAVAAGFALVVVAGYAPCGTERDLGADAAAALFAFLFDSVLRAFDVQCAADFGVDAFCMGLGTVQHGIALAAELQFVRLQQGVLMGLAVRTVFAFAVGRFGVDIDAGLGTNGNPDADLYAGIAVFAVLMLAVLGGEQPDVARGIEADGVARSNVAALDGNVALAAADIDVAASFQAAAVAGADAHAAGAVAAFVADVFKAETAGGEFVVVFICGRSDGTAFESDAVGCDVVAAFAGKETALAADVKRQPEYFSDCLFEEMEVICFSISQ